MLGRFKNLLLGWAACLVVMGCGTGPPAGQASSLNRPCAFALAPSPGEGPLDRRIRQLQERLRNSDSLQVWEQLGWHFVSKARLSYDSGFYKLAEQCALCMESKGGQYAPSALLLRGHALHSQHRFKEAEALARRLVATRGISFDYGLLGDILLDQGKLNPAADAYQKMVDLRPGMRAYNRAAQVRWLKGDLNGALQLERLAAQAASPRDAEAAAWTYARLALYELQAGQAEQAIKATDQALQLVPEYAPALLARGRILLAEGKPSQAAQSLQRAAQLNPLPEYLWAFAEALRAAGRRGEAREAERLLGNRTAGADARTLSLYWATRGEQVEEAVRLAQEELENRQDIHTFDALAWALQAAGRTEEARRSIQSAIAEGTQDARIFLHAGVIQARAGEFQQAARYLNQARALKGMLLPSEQALLAKFMGSLTAAGRQTNEHFRSLK